MTVQQKLLQESLGSSSQSDGITFSTSDLAGGLTVGNVTTTGNIGYGYWSREILLLEL